MTDDRDDNISYIHRSNDMSEELLSIAKLMANDGTGNTINELQNKPAKTNVNISGTGNIIGNNNTINITTNKTPKPKIIVKTGEGSITAAQKAKLKDLINEWIATYNAVKKSTLSNASAWARLNKKMKVNSYHEIPDHAFDDAIKYLRVQIGQIKRMASAPKKVVGWRSTQVKAIQARSNEKGIQDWRKDYMAKNFGKSSMTELTDKELQQLYQAVMGKK